MRNPGADIEDVYVHRGLDEVVTAIGGHYRFTREVRLPFGGQELLYRCGYAVFDTTCCGRGGCSYVVVQGFIRGWKYGMDEQGLPVSRVEPVRDPDVQKKIRALIMKTEAVSQVNFH
jgi:hypothetical protein